MIGAEDHDEEEFAACGSRLDPQEERLSWFRELWRSLKSVLKERDAPKNLQPEPENSRTNENSCCSLEWSYDSQRSDQSNRLRPNFSADRQPPSTKNQFQDLEEEYLTFEWEEDEDDSRNHNLHRRA